MRYAVFAAGVLDHDDGIGARGDRSAGHNLDCFVGTDDARETVAGADFADDAEAPGKVGGAKGESVADGAGESGGVAVGGDGLGENASGAIGKPHGFDRRQRAGSGDDANDHLARLSECQRGHFPIIVWCDGEGGSAPRTRSSALRKQNARVQQDAGAGNLNASRT